MRGVATREGRVWVDLIEDRDDVDGRGRVAHQRVDRLELVELHGTADAHRGLQQGDVQPPTGRHGEPQVVAVQLQTGAGALLRRRRQFGREPVNFLGFFLNQYFAFKHHQLLPFSRNDLVLPIAYLL